MAHFKNILIKSKCLYLFTSKMYKMLIALIPINIIKLISDRNKFKHRENLPDTADVRKEGQEAAIL